MSADLNQQIQEIIQTALKEDQALNDVTSDAVLDEKNQVNFAINAREDLVFCGEKIIIEVFAQLKKSVKFQNSKFELQILAQDAEKLKAGATIAKGCGEAKLIFAAERVILNLMQHLSGVATITNQFVETLNNSKIKILDTRKTIPAMRYLQKYGVKCGGGQNHRFNLSDMVLIKDNHIAAAKSVKNAVLMARQYSKRKAEDLGLNQAIKVEVECDTYQQVKQAILAEPDVIMLDNMKPSQIKKCSALIRSYKNKEIAIEISGGINLKTIKKFQNLDIDFISIGSLTHSVKAVDIGLDIVS